jgi:hypothetical protein
MIITPVKLSQVISKKDYNFSVTTIPVQVASPMSILDQLGISDMSDDIEMLVGVALPNRRIPIHKDSPLLNGTPIKWSLILVPTDEEVDVDLEIVEPFPNSVLDSGIGPIGAKRYSHRRENCNLIESWNLKNGSCYFNPTLHWHGLANNLDKLQIIFSLRSGTIEIDDVLKRIC